ncbi:MAG: hypothetical protein J0I12_25320 [Candidatus Eremiobacteraeota bacterium]|nr:hypothetical protein [Candidatus Eremiobacteraeota bacterium]
MRLLLILLWLAWPAFAEDFCGPHPCPIHLGQLCRCEQHQLCAKNVSPTPALPRQELLCPAIQRPLQNQERPAPPPTFPLLSKPEDLTQAPEPPPPRSQSNDPQPQSY